jgi:hypothetical protein
MQLFLNHLIKDYNMPTADEIRNAKETLYQTSGVRDDLNDDEATILLQWAETRIDYLATQDGDFDQQNRFLRQLLARIDRFVGQRQYMDEASHNEHVDNLMKAMAITHFGAITREQIMANLPADKADMRANLQAILDTLTPPVLPAPTIASPSASQALAGGLASVAEEFTADLSDSQAVWTGVSDIPPDPNATPKKDDETDPNNPLKGFIRRLKNLGDMT